MSFACCDITEVFQCVTECMCVRVHSPLDGAPLSPTLHHPQGCSYWLLLWCVWCIIGPNVWGGGLRCPSVIKMPSCVMELPHSNKVLRQVDMCGRFCALYDMYRDVFVNFQTG